MSLTSAHSKVLDEISKLRHANAAAKSLSWNSRGYISELLLIRTYSVVEWLVEEVAVKLVLGHTYCDGQPSDALATFGTRVAAVNYIKNQYPTALRSRRPIVPSYLRWSNCEEIAKNVKNVFPRQNVYSDAIANHKNSLEEMRAIRNHCAHRSSSTKIKYNRAVQCAFGARSNLSVPVFLLSEKRSSPAMLEKYFIIVIAFSKDITKST